MRRRLVSLAVPMAALIATAGAAIGSTERLISAPDLVRDRTGFEAPMVGTNVRAMGDTLLLPSGELSEDHAVRAALWNNREVSAAFQEIGVAQAEYRQAVLPKNPTVEAEIRFGGTGRNPGELAAMQDLTSILFASMRKRAARESVRSASLRAANAALLLVAEARSAFYAYQSAEQSRRLLERAVQATQLQADVAQRQHEVGNITDLDLENEQALYEQAKVALSRGQFQVAEAAERLNRVMGLGTRAATWSVSADLAPPPADGVPIAALDSVAVAQRLDLAAADAEIRAIERSVSVARYEQWPELRAGVHVEQEPEGTRTVGPAVEIAFPLFDRGQASVAKAHAQLRAAQDRRSALAVDVRSEARLAGERLESARQLVEYYQTVVLPRRKRIAEQTRLQFNSMLVGLPQLVQANREELNAQREFIEALRDYWTARAELERAVAGSLPRTG